MECSNVVIVIDDSEYFPKDGVITWKFIAYSTSSKQGVRCVASCVVLGNSASDIRYQSSKLYYNSSQVNKIL